MIRSSMASKSAVKNGVEGAPLLNDKYKEFVTMQYSSHTLFVAAVVNTLFNVLILPDFDFIASNAKMSPRYNYFYATTISLRFVVVVMLWIIWAFKTEGSILNYKASPHYDDPWIFKLQSLCPVLLSTVLCTLVVTNDNFQPHNAGQLYLMMCALKAYPLVTSFVLRDTSSLALGISWGLCIIALLVNGFQTESIDRLVDATSYTFTTGIILYDTYRRNTKVFGLVNKLLDTLKENEALAVEAQALELRAMIGNVAHDLKTPLTSFLGGIEFMREVVASWECKLDSPDFCAKAAENFTALRNCLRTMEGTNSFMTMTINRCLDYTKASKGFKLVPKLGTVCIEKDIEFAVQLVNDQQSSSARIHLNPKTSDICSHIITDRQWLVANLLCLLSNAVKYSSKGTVEVSVLLEPAEAGGESHLRFEVHDTGIGLSDKAMASLFNPFKQAQRMAGGTGLGLYSLAMRVEALHGQYGVSKRPDGAQGSLFWFTIPYRPDELSANLATEAAFALLSPRSVDDNSSPEDEPLRSLRVLVVDDAPMIVKMTTMLLKRKGHSVQHAVNGAEALEKIQQGCDDHQRPFDVVLMDLQMPVLDGIETLRRLRRTMPSPEVPVAVTNPLSLDFSKLRGCISQQFVIALSANSDEGTMQEALDAGADAFMPKPFTYETFLEVVRRHNLK